MSLQKRVLLWSSHAHRTQGGNPIPAASAGGFENAVETHGGENNGAAQARFCPATGKYSELTGLGWMRDVKSFGSFWSGHSADPVIGGGAAGKTNLHDYVHGGPNTRMEHVHVLDCAGYDTLKIYWTGKCRAYEGLSISDAAVLSENPTLLRNQQMADCMRVAAAGMPVIDSADSMYALPKLMRLNENDSLATEGAEGSFSTFPTFTTDFTTNIVTSTAGVVNGDIVRLRTSAADLPDGLLVDTAYFVVQANAAGTAFKLSLTLGGAEINILDNGTGTHTLVTPAKYPGSGKRRGLPWAAAGLETDINWEPDVWIQGGEPLWAQYKGGLYPGSGADAATNRWTVYDQVVPALSFEGNNFNVQAGVNGPPGMLQWGKVYKDALGIMKSYKWTQAGDRFETSMWIGYPTRTFQHGSAATSGFNVMANNGGPALSISGLARICLVIGSIRLSWHGEGLNAHMVQDQSSRNEFADSEVSGAGNGSTYLVSSPVAPATAPRQHVSGSIWAVLSSNTGNL